MTEPWGIPAFTVEVEKTPELEIRHRSPSRDFPYHNRSTIPICTNILPSCCYMNCPCSCPKPTSSLTHGIPFLSCPQGHHSSDYPSPFWKFKLHVFNRPFSSGYKFLLKIKEKLHYMPYLTPATVHFTISSKATLLKRAKVATIISSSSLSWNYSNLTFDLKTPTKCPLKTSTLLANQIQR